MGAPIPPSDPPVPIPSYPSTSNYSEDPYRPAAMRARFGIWAGLAALVTGSITIIAPLAGVMQPAVPGAEVAFAVSTGFLGIAFGYFFATEHT